MRPLSAPSLTRPCHASDTTTDTAFYLVVPGQGLVQPTDDGPAISPILRQATDSSDMVAFGEPFFMAVDAEVEVVPIMNADDLQKGLGKLG